MLHAIWMAPTRAAGEQGGTAPAVLNAANEVAVEAFLTEEIPFAEIPRIIEECVTKCAGAPEPTLGNFLEAIEMEPVPEMIAHPRENPYVFYEEYFEEGDEDEEDNE